MRSAIKGIIGSALPFRKIILAAGKGWFEKGRDQSQDHELGPLQNCLGKRWWWPTGGEGECKRRGQIWEELGENEEMIVGVTPGFLGC